MAYAAALASFVAGVALGYLLAAKRRASFLAAKRELSIQLSAPLDLDPSEFSHWWEGRQ